MDMVVKVMVEESLLFFFCNKVKLLNTTGLCLLLLLMSKDFFEQPESQLMSQKTSTAKRGQFRVLTPRYKILKYDFYSVAAH